MKNLSHLLAIILLTGTASYRANAATPYRQWRVAEFSFEAEKHDQVTPPRVRVTARFTGPDGAVFDVPAFWDGGGTWRVRFAPTLPGRWTYRTEAIGEVTPVFTKLYAGDIMRGGDAARRVDVPIADAEELRLIIDDGGDGGNYDHADWGDAHIVTADGTIVYLDARRPSSAHQGHGELSLRTNLLGKPLRIAGRTFPRGLGSHAKSEICYKLDGTERRFRAWTGVDATVHTNGSVRFHVVSFRHDSSYVGRRDAGLHGKEGTFTALPATGENALYRHGGILRVSPDGHSLTHGDGTPFFWLGDTWWFCPSDLVPIDTSSNPDIASAYGDMLRVRRRQGFTTAHMAFLSTIDGVNPFSEAMRRPNLSPAYWRKVDRYMRAANDNGIVPVIGMGWTGRPLAPADWRVLWRHVIARYGAHAVTWLVCGEYNVTGTDAIIDQTLALGQYIKDTDPYHRAMTIHPWAFAGDRRQAWDEPWYDFIMLQGGHGALPPSSLYLEACARRPARPVLEAECRYEGIHAFVAHDIRHAAYRAIQCGSFGFTYGAQGLWYPTQNEQDKRFDEWGKPLVWWKALRRPGAEQLGILRRIYETVPWWRLKPRPDAVTASADAAHDDVKTVCDLVAHFPDARATGAQWSRLSDTEANCIALHPLGGREAVLTYPPLALPRVAEDERLLLVLAYGISNKANLEDPQNPSDGVHFSVMIDGKRAFRQHSRSKTWTYRAIDLTPRAGGNVKIALATAPGASSSWDHALFRRPMIVRTGKDNPSPCRETYLATPPRPVYAKADGDRVFVLYFPSDVASDSHRTLNAPAHTVYTAMWHNPRTGATLPAKTLTAHESGLNLPHPQDKQDWVLILRKRNPATAARRDAQGKRKE